MKIYNNIKVSEDMCLDTSKIIMEDDYGNFVKYVKSVKLDIVAGEPIVLVVDCYEFGDTQYIVPDNAFEIIQDDGAVIKRIKFLLKDINIDFFGPLRNKDLNIKKILKKNEEVEKRLIKYGFVSLKEEEVT